MSCHEKLLERKRQHEHEKKKRNSQKNATNRTSTMDKSLPEVPLACEPLNYSSPGSTLSVSGEAKLDDLTFGTTDTLDIPMRSPARTPKSADKKADMMLDDPVSFSPTKALNNVSPRAHPTDAFSKPNDEKLDYMKTRTPRGARPSSPMRQVENNDNRHAHVVESLSSSSSTNILSSYTKKENTASPARKSPPPKVAAPSLPPDDDFIDMDDSDNDIITPDYLKETRGFGSTMKHSDSIPTGLNIQGLQSFDEDFNHTLTTTTVAKERKDSFPTDPLEGTSADPKQFLSPGALKKTAQTNLTNATEPSSSLSRSLSLRSPKNFLSFRKHKKTPSQNSLESYKISSPMIDNTNTGPFNEAHEDTTIESLTMTPKTNKHSPYQGAALFTTPPVPTTHHHHHHHSHTNRKLSTHSRSRSDINTGDDVISSELELRSLRTEITNLKMAKSSLLAEISQLSSQRDTLNLEILQLHTKFEELKIIGQSSKSSLEDVSEIPASGTSSTYSGSQAQLAATVSASNSSTTVPLITTNDSSVQMMEDGKQPRSKARFWKRGNFFSKSELLSSSVSSNSINQMGNDSNKNGNPQISAPIMRKEETDELGGNDNKKLLNTKGIAVEQVQLLKHSGTHGLIMSDLFSSSLEARAQYENRPIPLIVTRLINEIEKRGLDSEGIYRKNGASSQTNAIIKAFNNLYQAETSSELENSLQVGDVNAISSALKRYLYFHLPEPVITTHEYETFISINRIPSDQDKLSALAKVVLSLPKTNELTLVAMLRHLKRVESMSTVNKMTYHNLAVVFAPTFTRTSDGEKELLDMAQRNNVTEFLLMRQDEILQLVDEQY